MLDKKEIILNFVQEASSYLHYKILDIRRDVDEYIFFSTFFLIF